MSACPALSNPADHVRALIAAGAPAAGVALWDGDTTVCTVGGVRAAGQSTPVAEGDLWHIGSITKSMTATLAARLVTAGQLRWDDTLGDVLGAALPDLHPDTRAITLTQLLSHRAGLVPNLGTLASLNLIRTQAGADLRQQRLAYAGAILKDPPEATPGQSFTYSNAGYVIAGAMMEAATGESWEALMQAHVFGPLGLTSAGFGPPGIAGTLDQPRGHTAGLLGGLQSREPGPFADNPAAMGPAGTVHISLCDLMQYAIAHAERSTDYLPVEAWEMLHSDKGDRYALGWGVGINGVLTHSGSNTLWFAQVAFWPETKYALAIVTNDGRIDSIGRPVAEAVEALAP